MTIKHNAVDGVDTFGILRATYEGKPFVARVTKHLYWVTDNPEVSKILWRKHWVQSRESGLGMGGYSIFQLARRQLMSAYRAFGGILELGPDPPPKPESEWNPPPPEELRDDS